VIAATQRLLPALTCCVAACATLRSPPPDGPYVVVLGTAQDGGLPQIGCLDAPCERARRDHARRRFASSILIVDPRSGSRWLVDAGPDLREQTELARHHPIDRLRPGARPLLFDGIFLTHAHVGHYAGLAHLGREVYGARETPVYASPRMREFLAENGPWSLLVETRAIELVTLTAGEPVELAPGLSLTPLTVPHRDEFSDTLAFVVHGPNRALLYLPDIDKWERWNLPFEEVLATVDVALVDGTFFDADELPGRDLAEIPHPFVVETLERLRHAAPDLGRRVVFTHLNHTNAAADPASSAAARIRAAGCRVAREGEIVEL
jgi:pyrroloquinoline quinone biosynthesis protein B